MNILEARKAGLTWAECATACGLGSETAARRAYKRESVEGLGKLIRETREILPSINLFTEDPDVDSEEGNLQRVLFVPDPHIPYENKTTWALMLEASRSWCPDVIVLLGDFGDFKAVSSHLKNPIDKTRMKWEVEQVNRRLDLLDALQPKRKIYLAGNHEWRLQRYLQERAPELFDFLSVPKLFRLEERGWEYVEYMQHARLGELYLTHSGGGTGIGSARKAMDTFGHSVVSAHAHRLQYVVEGNAAGGAKVSALFGWMGDINEIDYMERAKAMRDWAQGFGIGYLNSRTGAVHLVPVPVVDGSVVVEGILYTVRDEWNDPTLLPVKD